MFEVLDRIREKPRAQKQAIALGITTVITGAIFVLWFISFITAIHDEKEVVAQPENSFGFDTFIDSFQEARTVIQEEVGAARDQFESLNNELQKTVPVTDAEENIIKDDQPIIPPAIQDDEVTPSGIEIIQVEI